MLVLAEHETIPGRRGKAGFYGGMIGKLSVLTMVLYCPAAMRERQRQKLLCRAFRLLDKRPSAEIVFRDDFPFTEEFCEAGFAVCGEQFLLRKKAWETALCGSEGRESVFISLDSLGEAERQTIDRLCQKYRYMLLSAPDEVFGEAAKRLAVYGVSPIRATPGLIRADAAILFAQPEAVSYFTDLCCVVPLAGERGYFGGRTVKHIDFVFPEELLNEIPPGYPALKIASYAAEKGLLDTKLVNVAGVTL